MLSPKTVNRLLAGLTALFLLSVVTFAQNSSGGSFLPGFSYVVGGQWTWRGQASPFVFEGTTDDGNETTITVTNPTSDGTWTLPSGSGGSFVGTTATQTLTNKTLTAPVLGASTATSLAATGAITSSGVASGVGYATGAGCTVTQMTNRSTGVTCTGMSGFITTDATSLAAAAEAVFTVTNTSVAIGDVVVLSARSGQTAGTSIPFVTTVTAGSFDITLSNVHASTADTGAMIIQFAVLKAVGS